jgi:hypothetical protein
MTLLGELTARSTGSRAQSVTVLPSPQPTSLVQSSNECCNEISDTLTYFTEGDRSDCSAGLLGRLSPHAYLAIERCSCQ